MNINFKYDYSRKKKTTPKFTYKSMINSLKYANLLLFKCKIKGHNLHLSLSREQGLPYFLQYLAYNTKRKKKKEKRKKEKNIIYYKLLILLLLLSKFI